MDIIIFWLAVALLWTILLPWLIRKSDKNQKILNLTKIKEYLYEKIDFTNRFDIGSTFSRGDYIVVYNKLQYNTFVSEKIIISNHPVRGKSNELVVEYQNGDIVAIKLNGRSMNTNVSPENYQAIHKILELGQHAFKGDHIP